MRRLTFAHGMPGVGLLILRLAVGIGLALGGLKAFQGKPSIEAAALHILVAGAGIPLLVG